MACTLDWQRSFSRHVPGHLWECEYRRQDHAVSIWRLLHNGKVAREATCVGMDAGLYVSDRWLVALIENVEAPDLP